MLDIFCGCLKTPFSRTYRPRIVDSLWIFRECFFKEQQTKRREFFNHFCGFLKTTFSKTIFMTSRGRKFVVFLDNVYRLQVSQTGRLFYGFSKNEKKNKKIRRPFISKCIFVVLLKPKVVFNSSLSHWSITGIAIEIFYNTSVSRRPITGLIFFRSSIDERFL